MKNAKIVCLGGGMGTVNLIHGLKRYTENLTAVVSMADDGGSAGRLRRLYDIQPPGDIVSCIAALIDDKHEVYRRLLTYRFPGDRYGEDYEIYGHKLGNLMMVAARDTMGDFDKAVSLLKEIFQVKENILPATKEKVTISAVTVEGKNVDGEENIDLGKYEGKHAIEKVSLSPADPLPGTGVISAMEKADIIIAGPGDLYTTILPVLLIPEIKKTLLAVKAQKIFVVNVANKPFETDQYKLSDFIAAVFRHLGLFPFDTLVVNNNFSLKLPEKLSFSYVTSDTDYLIKHYPSLKIAAGDLLDAKYPAYHDSQKLAKLIMETL